MTAPTPDLEFLARNIINQIGDLWHERIPSEKWVPVRQATNYQLDVWVAGLSTDALAAVTAERDQARKRLDDALDDAVKWSSRYKDARKQLADAPHADDCTYLEEDVVEPYGTRISPNAHCDCWKAGL